jgi:hypothetical protein
VFVGEERIAPSIRHRPERENHANPPFASLPPDLPEGPGRVSASFGVATTASGQLLLDQESPFELGFTQFSERPAAQTFTVGASGDLESVEVTSRSSARRATC